MASDCSSKGKIYLHHLLIYVSDLERSKEFYTEKLDLQVLLEEDGYLRVGASAGPFIGLHKGNAEEVGAKGIELEFLVEDVDQRYKELVSKGVRFSQAPEAMHWGARHAFLEDPDGYKISIFTP